MGAGTVGLDPATVLARDGADEEESEAGAFDLDGVAAGDAVEALEDAFQLGLRNAEAAVGDGERDEGVVGDGEGAANIEVGEAGRRILDGVFQQVEDGGAEVLGDAEDAEPDADGDGREGDAVGREVVAGKRDGDAVGDQRGQVDEDTVLLAGALAEFAGFQDLLDGGEETVGVGVHDGVELLALGFVEIRTPLEGIEIEADAGDGGLELVRDGVEEGVLALVAADFADEEDGVEDDANDQEGEEDDTQDQIDEVAAVQDDPADVERDGDTGEQHAERDEGGDGSAASGDVHKDRV